jgi:hypothetical protein
MAKKILKVASLGLIGGKKKSAPAEKTGPVVTPLAADSSLNPNRKRRSPLLTGRDSVISPTILSDRLGG